MSQVKTINTNIFDPYYFRKDDVYCVKHKWYNKTYKCLLKSYKHDKLIFWEVGTDKIINVDIDEYQNKRVIITKMDSDIESVYFDDDIQVIIVRDTVNQNWIAFNSKYEHIRYLCDLMDDDPEAYKKRWDEIKDDKFHHNAFGIGITPNKAVNELIKEIHDNGRVILTKSWMKENKNK